MTPATTPELLIDCVAGLLEGIRHVAVGAASPIPGAAALLARERARTAGRRLFVSVLGATRANFFTNGGVELFDCAAQGRLDAFFLGGGEIDGQGNINLVGLGDYPRQHQRWPGSFGSAYLYHLVPRVILFREEHSRRVLVERVAFVSAAGRSAPDVYRPGGAIALLTSKALFDFDRQQGRFTLRSIHPGGTLEEIRDLTGFAFDCPAAIATTAPPDTATLAAIRGPVRRQLAEVYPRFAAALPAAA
jgi:glutaconate CoA-transferase subunit B